MDITLTEARKVKLPSGAVQMYPAGWSGEVPSAHARQWIEEGVAMANAAPVRAGHFTADQTAILAAAADEILSAARAAADGEDGADGTEEEGGADDDDTADGVVAAVDDDGEIVDLSMKSDDELRAIAEGLGISPGRKKRETLIATIEAKAAELQAQAEDA